MPHRATWMLFAVLISLGGLGAPAHAASEETEAPPWLTLTDAIDGLLDAVVASPEHIRGLVEALDSMHQQVGRYGTLGGLAQDEVAWFFEPRGDQPFPMALRRDYPLEAAFEELTRPLGSHNREAVRQRFHAALGPKIEALRQQLGRSLEAVAERPSGERAQQVLRRPRIVGARHAMGTWPSDLGEHANPREQLRPGVWYTTVFAGLLGPEARLYGIRRTLQWHRPTDGRGVVTERQAPVKVTIERSPPKPW